MSESARKFPGWLLPAGLGILVVALVAVALTRGPVTLNPDSPEGAVQEYLKAVEEERWDDAVEVLHEDWRGECEGTDIAMFSQGEFTASLGAPGGGFSGGMVFEEEFQVVGEEEPPPTMPDSTTQVEVTINHNDGIGLGSSWSEYVLFELYDDGEFWWLVGDPWPYFIWNCQNT